jgi:hypothetical protein
MTTALVGTDSVHTTAAACDYLGPRLGPDDTAVFCTVVADTVSERDAGDAGNVARTRLVEPTVAVRDPEHRAGDETVADVLQTVAAECDADELLVGSARGDPENAGDAPGATVRELLATSERPVVVVRV